MNMWLEGKLLMENPVEVRKNIKAQNLERNAPDVMVKTTHVKPVQQ